MQHLSLETLARIVDEPATCGEAGHLERCPDCRAELEGLREQTAQLSALEDPAPPAHLWPTLRLRMEAEGLIRNGTDRAPAWRHGALRTAAAVLLFAAGTAFGAALIAPATSGARPSAPVAAAVAGTLASAPATPEEARQLLQQRESAYLDALTYYAQLTTPAEAVDPLNRLAALEGIVLTTRAALREAPADPVINGYHLAALSQREALLRQIGQASGRGGDDEWF